MIKSRKNERRLHPRIKQRLPFRIAANGYDLMTTTDDISCLGAYCNINKYIPPFTKIAVKMSIAVVTEDGKRQDYVIECNGVIVRVTDDSKGGFNIAIFFNRINDTQRKVISSYVSQFMPSN